jgi:uncharacterized protein with GYD domain
MPTYVGLLKWTDQGIKNVKESPSLIAQGIAGLEQQGARLIGFWWTQGEYDAVIVGEWPDDESVSVAARRECAATGAV